MSTQAVVDAITGAAAARTPLRVCGRSTWLDAGRPVASKTTLTLRDDSGVVSYVPGDLTLTVRAGTSLAEIERATAEHDQWLPLDPYGSSDGTIGATISTASAGPLATNFGLPRDLVLGLEFVTGRGEVIRSGGKVVKNVAGFDLSRLLAGSWGTLGVITEATLRLYARPKVDRTFVVRLGGNEKETSTFLRTLFSAPVNPYALELLNASTSSSLGIGTHSVALVRLGGNEAAVDSQILVLSRLRATEEVDRTTWDRLRSLEGASESVIRVSGLPARFRETSATILADSIPNTFTYINPARGVLRLVMRANSDGDASAAMQPPTGDDHLVFEKLPAEVWPSIPSVVSDPLSSGIKRVYDPNNILNPGILG